MGKQHASAGKSKGPVKQQQHRHLKVGRGNSIVKSKPKSTMSALAASIAASRSSNPSAAASLAASSAVSVVTLLGQYSNNSNTQDQDAQKLVELLHECLMEVGGKAPLTVIGSQLRDKAVRRSLAEGSTDRPLHKYLKERWSGLENFVRVHMDDFVLGEDHTVQRRDGGASHVLEAPALMEQSSARGCLLSAAVVSSNDVNSLTLDGL